MGHGDTERVALTAHWRDRERKQCKCNIQYDVYDILDPKNTFTQPSLITADIGKAFVS